MGFCIVIFTRLPLKSRMPREWNWFYTGYLSLEATHRSISGFQAKTRMKISVAVYAVKNYRKCHSSKHFNAFKCIFKERKNSLCFQYADYITLLCVASIPLHIKCPFTCKSRILCNWRQIKRWQIVKWCIQKKRLDSFLLFGREHRETLSEKLRRMFSSTTRCVRGAGEWNDGKYYIISVTSNAGTTREKDIRNY